MSLDDMDREGHTTVTMHTVWHEYAPTTIFLSTYLCHKVKERSWPEKVTHITMRVHYTEFMITPHMQAYMYIHTYIHTSGTMPSHRARKWNKHCQRSRGIAQQGTRNVKQTLPYSGNAAQAKSRKSKWYKERGNPNTCSKEEVYKEREKKRIPLRRG